MIGLKALAARTSGRTAGIGTGGCRAPRRRVRTAPPGGVSSPLFAVFAARSTGTISSARRGPLPFLAFSSCRTFDHDRLGHIDDDARLARRRAAGTERVHETDGEAVIGKIRQPSDVSSISMMTRLGLEREKTWNWTFLPSSMMKRVRIWSPLEGDFRLFGLGDSGVGLRDRLFTGFQRWRCDGRRRDE